MIVFIFLGNNFNLLRAILSTQAQVQETQQAPPLDNETEGYRQSSNQLQTQQAQELAVFNLFTLLSIRRRSTRQRHQRIIFVVVGSTYFTNNGS